MVDERRREIAHGGNSEPGRQELQCRQVRSLRGHGSAVLRALEHRKCFNLLTCATSPHPTTPTRSTFVGSDCVIVMRTGRPAMFSGFGCSFGLLVLLTEDGRLVRLVVAEKWRKERNVFRMRRSTFLRQPQLLAYPDCMRLSSATNLISMEQQPGECLASCLSDSA